MANLSVTPAVPGFKPMVQRVPGQPPTMTTPQPKEPAVAHTGLWIVRLGGHEQRVVNAGSRAGAWDAYRKLFGIVTSDWPPEIGEVQKEQKV
jgi:hypothetical protein